MGILPLSGLDRLRLSIVLATLGGMAVVLLLIAVKPIFLGFDSINNYVHVWFISRSLYEAGSIPLRVPWLENGQALTYPYAWLPWTVAAVVRPVLGDYAVTWTMVIGFVLMNWVAFRTRLHSDSWLLALFLLYPLQLNGLLAFQMAFVYGALFGYLYVHALERGARWQALLWYVLSVTTHLTMMAPILTAYNLYAFISNRECRRLVLWVVLLGLPAMALVGWHSLQAPTVGASPPVFLFFATLETAVTRSTLFFLPFLLVKASRWLSSSKAGMAVAGAMLALSVSAALPFGTLAALVVPASNPYSEFLASANFAPGAHYRLLEASNREQGHYFFVQRGAVLAQELFSESQVRRNWTPGMYQCFLTAKGIDSVAINQEYNAIFRTNEEQLLETMVARGQARLTYADPLGRFNVYDVRGARQPVPVPVRRCFDQ